MWWTFRVHTEMREVSATLLPTGTFWVCSKICGYHIIICRTFSLCYGEADPKPAAKASTGLPSYLLQGSPGLNGQHPLHPVKSQWMWYLSLPADLNYPVHHCHIHAMFQNSCISSRRRNDGGKRMVLNKTSLSSPTWDSVWMQPYYIPAHLLLCLKRHN